MKKFKFIYFFLIFFNYDQTFSFEIINSINSSKIDVFSHIEKLENSSFIEYLNNDKNKVKDFIIKYETIDQNKDSYMSLNFNKYSSFLIFDNRPNISCISLGLESTRNIKEGSIFDEILLRSTFNNNSRIFYRVKDNIILKIKSKDFKRGYSSITIYSKDNIKKYIDFVNIIKYSKTNQVSNLLTSFTEMPPIEINGEYYYPLNISIRNINPLDIIYSEHINIFLEKSFLPIVDNIEFLEVFRGNCNYPINFDNQHAYYKLQNINQIENIECVNCNYKIYSMSKEKSLNKKYPDLYSAINFENFIIQNHDNFFYSFLSQDNYFSQFIKNLHTHQVISKNNYPDSLEINNFKILNSKTFEIFSDKKKYTFFLEKNNFENENYYYHKGSLIKYNYFIKNHLCSINKFSKKNFQEIVIEKKDLNKNFKSLNVNDAFIKQDNLYCIYKINNKIKSFYQGFNYNLDPNFLIKMELSELENPLFIANKKFNKINEDKDFYLIKIIFLIFDFISLLLIIILIIINKNKINFFIIFLSLLIFFIVFLFSNNFRFFLSNYIFYYLACYLIFISLTTILTKKLINKL